MEPKPETETVRLWGFSETIQDPVKSMLFGELVKRAAPHIVRWHSDLFHDARIVDTFGGPTVFHYMVRDYGTHLNRDPRDMLGTVQVFTDYAGLWRVELLEESGSWSATFTPIDRGWLELAAAEKNAAEKSEGAR